VGELATLDPVFAGFEASRLGIFVFMFVNGAVVFASGVGRLVGIVAVGVVLAATLARRPRTVIA
jgi:hypothetical protein